MGFLHELQGRYDRIRIPVGYSRRVVCLLVRIGSDRHILRVHLYN